MDPGAPIWTPPPERVARANLTAFMAEVHRQYGADVSSYRALHAWSVQHRERFWPAVWRFSGLRAEERPGRDPWVTVGTGLDRMAPPDSALGPRWFPGARLNFAENLLRFGDERPAIVFRNESGRRLELSCRGLRSQVARCSAALAAQGLGPDDRVAGLLPNFPETVIAMLGATSLGAVWSSCSPDFGVGGVVDRFGQIDPRILFCVDGYRYAGKDVDCLDRVAAIVERIPSIERVVVIPYLRERPWLNGVRGAVRWDDWLPPEASASPPRYPRLPFDHPVYILYSSGTTGLPKCMVHGAGGTLLQHQKEHLLHVDLRRDDRILYFTTCAWMMWNWLASALAVGATVVLYDGAPFWPSPAALWDLVRDEQISVFGTSARYLALCEKEALAPARTHDLAALRTLISTGSPLSAHGYGYVYREVKRDLHLCNISGGTELISCFAIGNPLDPVRAGEMQGPGLGMAVQVWDPAGTPLARGAGELVCTSAFPSMPVAFWRDPHGARYRAAYFERFPGVWRHGDWAEWTEHGGLVIHGRSDATLNPGGVRIGTAELYRQLDGMDEIVESLAIGLRAPPPGDDDERIVLFVRLTDGRELDDALRDRIRRRIREGASPRHVPAKIVQVADLPRTISGKISELAVRAVLHGLPVDNRDALANPESLELFRSVGRG